MRRNLLLIMFVLIFGLSACQSPPPPATVPVQTVTPFPAYKTPTPGPNPALQQVIMTAGDKMTLKTGGDGYVVITVQKLDDGVSFSVKPALTDSAERWKGWDWYVDVQSNMTGQNNLDCMFNSYPDFGSPDCQGRLQAEGEIWPNQVQRTGLEDKGLRLVGTRDGVRVEYEAAKWQQVAQ